MIAVTKIFVNQKLPFLTKYYFLKKYNYVLYVIQTKVSVNDLNYHDTIDQVVKCYILASPLAGCQVLEYE